GLGPPGEPCELTLHVPSQREAFVAGRPHEGIVDLGGHIPDVQDLRHDSILPPMVAECNHGRIAIVSPSNPESPTPCCTPARAESARAASTEPGAPPADREAAFPPEASGA